MKITKICLENFLSYGQRCDINLQDISFLVGPNGSGKTNLLKAIITMGKVLAGQGKDIDQALIHMTNPNHSASNSK